MAGALKGSAGKQLPNKLKQEMWNLLAAHCREMVMAKKASGADEAAQFMKMEMCYHGADSHQSILELFLHGKEPCTCCFYEKASQSNRQGNENRSENMHELKEELHFSHGTSFTTQENGFDNEGLSLCRGKKVTGGKLNDDSPQACAAHKHALAHHKQCATSKGENPSGLSVEDMFLCVRRAMFVQYKGAINSKGSRTKTAEVQPDDVPDDCMFAGWLAFAVFGPMPLSKKSLSCLTEDGTNVETQSRAKTRKEDAKMKKLDRSAGAGGYVPNECQGRRGVTSQAKAEAAKMAQKDVIEKRRHPADLLFIHEAGRKTTLLEIKETRELLQDPLLTPKDRKLYEEHLEELQQDMRGSLKRKAGYQSQTDEMLKAPPSTQVTAFMDQVGDFDKKQPSSADKSIRSPVEASGNVDEPSAITTSAVLEKDGDGNGNDGGDDNESCCSHNEEPILSSDDEDKEEALAPTQQSAI